MKKREELIATGLIDYQAPVLRGSMTLERIENLHNTENEKIQILKVNPASDTNKTPEKEEKEQKNPQFFLRNPKTETVIFKFPIGQEPVIEDGSLYVKNADGSIDSLPHNLGPLTRVESFSWNPPQNS